MCPTLMKILWRKCWRYGRLSLYHGASIQLSGPWCRWIRESILSGCFVFLGCALLAGVAFGGAIASETAVRLRELEEVGMCRIGVALRDADGRLLFSHRGTELFALNSTFKALACARVWAEQSGQRRGPAGLGGLAPYAPEFGSLNPETSVSLDDACHAAMAVSDNRAANFIFALTGGPKALTAWLRELGDDTTSVDDIEPAINQWRQGETRNASTPEAVTATWLAIDRQLSGSARARWHAALAANRTADHLLRAVLPEGCYVGDRTGAGQGTRAIHARIEQAGGNTLYLAVHLQTDPDRSLPDRDKILSNVLKLLPLSTE